MKRRSLHWALWSVVCTIVVLGTLALEMASSASNIPIVLEENKDVALIQEHRLAPSLLQMSLLLNKSDENATVAQPSVHLGPVHGNWSNTHKSSNPNEANSIIFPEPGLPIELDLHWGGASHLFEALPASTNSSDYVVRELVPLAPDNNPNAFAWPVPVENRPILDTGITYIVVKTRAVPLSLRGQHAVLTIKPRVTFKYTTPGYELLWWFYFWPAYMAVLGAYGAWLLRKSSRCKKRRANKMR